MKIDDPKKLGRGSPLSSFNTGDCISLIGTRYGSDEPFIGHVYIVVDLDARRWAINLLDGCNRQTGKFVLEPNAKVVIE